MQEEAIRRLVPKELLRDVPGWKNAPVPACYGGDPRSLTFCCHPGYSLTFSYKCQRDNLLGQVGLTREKFIQIKDEFGREHSWLDERVCFKNLAYCCMRRGGCPEGRDQVLRELYPGLEWDDVLEKYFSLKHDLANKILKACNNQDLVNKFVDY
ncbi:MAG: hypothetical protein ACTSXU_17855 [Promethearchaeota archaeon]